MNKNTNSKKRFLLCFQPSSVVKENRAIQSEFSHKNLSSDIHFVDFKEKIDKSSMISEEENLKLKVSSSERERKSSSSCGSSFRKSKSARHLLSKMAKVVFFETSPVLRFLFLIN